MLTSSYLSNYLKNNKVAAFSHLDDNEYYLTSNNVNLIISSLYQLCNMDEDLSGFISGTYNELLSAYNTLNNNVIKFLNGEINVSIPNADHANQANYAISADYASCAISADYASCAISSNYALTANFAKTGYTKESLTFITNNNANDNKVFNGSSSTEINCILSSIYTHEGIHSVSADFSIHAISSTIAEQARNAGYSISASVASQTQHALLITSADETDYIYNGQYTVVVSSIFYSLSSQYSNEATTALTSYFDIDGNELNTLVQYLPIEDNRNYDYPILFSVSSIIQMQQNYQFKNQVAYNQLITYNPYLGAIKANYFIGTALSATYAICDANKNLLNTQVCQNQTSNNYNYPILLSFINKQVLPEDGANNQVLYTSTMRLNPYTNTIYAPDDMNDTNDIDVEINKKPNNTSNQTSLENGNRAPGYFNSYDSARYPDLDFNFIGLASRSYADAHGDEHGRYIIPQNNSEDGTLSAHFLLFTANKNDRTHISKDTGIYVVPKTNLIHANYFEGIATSAWWADLAENYITDEYYQPGTLVKFGGEKQLTIATDIVNGVISENPAYLMNSGMQGQPLTLTGRVKVKVIGKINKFDYIVLSDIPGIAKGIKQKTNAIIGRALETNTNQDIKLVLCVVRLQL